MWGDKMQINGNYNNYNNYNNFKPKEFINQESTEDGSRQISKDMPKTTPEAFEKTKAGLVMGTSNEEDDGEVDPLKIHIMCLEISRRIISGDKVPQSDYDFLLENDPEMYARSITMRVLKENPKEYKSLSEKAGQEDSFNSSIEQIVQNLSQISGSGGPVPASSATASATSPATIAASIDITV